MVGVENSVVHVHAALDDFSASPYFCISASQIVLHTEGRPSLDCVDNTDLPWTYPQVDHAPSNILLQQGLCIPVVDEFKDVPLEVGCSLIRNSKPFHPFS